MMIPALSLLSFFLATQLVAAASTDEQIIEARLNVLHQSLSSQCQGSYQYCAKKYVDEHQGQQIDYCQAIIESKSCGVSEIGKCTENEYGRVKEVGCMCKDALDAFRGLENLIPSVSDNCKNKAQTCTGGDVYSIGATINDYCNALQKYKQCLTSGSNSCSQETYDKFEAVACHVKCGGIKVAQYSVFLMIITSFLKFL